jgi:predicted alpha/beta superfamily hydrolase
VILIWAGTCAALSQENSAGTQLPMVPILGTQQLKLHSAVVGRDYVLDISLPRGYRDTSKYFPVLFLLDSQWDFPLVNAVFGEQYYDGFVPDIVIVGISPAGEHPNYDSLRVSDLTPATVKGMPQSGNAAKFLECIKREAIPLIESRYRVKHDDRALMGSSLGGLFTLYAMFHETGSFSRYILTSPSVGWDNGVLFTYEKEYAAKNSNLPVHLFMARAELEGGGPDYDRFVDQLKGRHYAGLDFRTSMLEGMGHSGGKSIGYPRGLQAAYARPAVTLDASKLNVFVGKYRVNPEVTVSIVQEAGQLVLVAPDGTRIPLFASSEKDFFVKGSYLFLKFDLSETGSVTGARVETFDGNMVVTRVM